MSRILAFGEVLWDFIEGDKYFGGAPVNFAAHIVKCGNEASIVTAVGDDKLGIDAIDTMKALGVGVKYVQVKKGVLTGKVMVMLNNGQPTYRIKNDVAYDYIYSDQLDLQGLNSFDAFYFGTLAQRSATSRNTLEIILKTCSFNNIMYDVNLRRESYTKEVITSSLQYCTILKTNDEEVVTLSQLLYNFNIPRDLFVDRLMSEYPQIQIVLVTEGALGCTVITKTRRTQVPSKSVQIVDTVGAGDAFCASFLSNYLKSKNPVDAAKIANLVGGFVASMNGAVPEYSQELKARV